MKLVNIKYFVPRDNSELETLVKTKVGVKIGKSGPTTPMVYFGKDEKGYSFLKQSQREVANGSDPSIDDDYTELVEFVPTNRICVIRNYEDDIGFSDDGIILRSDKTYVDVIGPSAKDYNERVTSLKVNNLWKDTN